MLNYFALADQVVLSPVVLAAAPRSGRYDDGTAVEVFTEELTSARTLIGALTPEQRERAVVSAARPDPAIRAGAGQDNAVIPYEGLRASDLEPDRLDRVVGLIGLFVGLLDAGHAEVKMSELGEHLTATYLAWSGPTGPDSAFYLRIQSPVILVELDCQGQDVEIVIRTPNGNDYGKELMRQRAGRLSTPAASPSTVG